MCFCSTLCTYHHYEEIAPTHQSDHHDDDHDDLDHNFLEQAFSHFQHESNGGITFQTASQTFQCSQFSIDKEAILVTQYFIRQLFKPPVIHKEHFSFAFIPSNYSASSLFRGPPVA